MKYFLYESKEGYSAHFASAAVIMFRCFKIPARYVTGYAAPESIFAEDSDGNYTALLQSDNSHAWVEIYRSGFGWIPVETTPGNIGVLQTITREEDFAQQKDVAGEEIEVSENSIQPQNAPPEKKEDELQWKKINNWIFGIMLMGQILIVFVVIVKKIRKERKKRGYDKKESANERIQAIFSLMYRKMKQAGMPEEITSTSEEFKLWLERFLPSLSKREREEIISFVLESSYGCRAMTEEDVAWMRRIYKRALVGMKYYRKYK